MIGGAAALAYLAGSVFLDWLGVPSWASVTFGRACSIMVAYFGQLHFVFRVSADHRRRSWRFGVSRVINWLVSLLITYGLHDLAGFAYWVAAVAVVAATPAVSWPISRYWVFKEEGATEEACG
ncbi:MAG: GtrA family protein [Desulfosudaceae bacterium]